MATVYVITTGGKLMPLADLPAGESIKWWCVEGGTSWEQGEPPGAAPRQPATRRKVKATCTRAGLF